MEILVAGHTDRGHRLNNEDAFVIERDLYVIADAAGSGGISGLPAAELVLEAIVRSIDWPTRLAGVESLPRAIEYAGSRLWGRLETARVARARGAATVDDLEWIGRLSTVVAMHVIGGRASIAHVGDSRAYRLHFGVLEALTVDHRVPGHHVAMLTHALGMSEAVEIGSTVVPVSPGDTFMLCSDGLTDVVGDDEIAKLLGALGHEPSACCRMLVERALMSGVPRNIHGAENTTVIVARA